MGDILYSDDGNGFWVNESTGDLVTLNPQNGASTDGGGGEVISTRMVDYITANLTIPDLPQGTYYVKYKQDRYDNFAANSAAAVTLIEPKLDFENTSETFSTISLVPV